MSKGERTRKEIVERVAVLFNQKGYGASMQEITDATGVQRGGIYNHFESKEQLAIESFDYATGLIHERLQALARLETNAAERLHRIATSFARHFTGDTPFRNGCVVLNTAVEAKQHMPLLRERARGVMRGFIELVAEIVRSGIARGEIRSSADPETVATIFIATLEGAVLLSTLYDDHVHLDRAVEHLGRYAADLAA